MNKPHQPIAIYAKLAKLISNNCDEIDFLQQNDLADIIKMIKSIDNLNTDDIPEEFIFFQDEEFRNIREDVVTEGCIIEKVLINAQTKNNYFIAPKVMINE